MIKYKSLEEIELIRQSAQLVSKTLGMLSKEIHEGVTTKALDKLAHDFICDHDAKPGFLGLYNCPSTLLTSVNEQVVHGLPTDTPLKNGDIVAIDCGVYQNKFYGDHAYTFTVGEVSDEAMHLLKTTLESLYLGIEQMRTGLRLGDIGHAIQSHAEQNGFTVVRELVGHGLGKKMHEEPHVPNYGQRGKGKKLKNGLVLAIEPMVNQGTEKVEELSDGWTIVTKDRKLSAHFEHDVALVDGKPEILSTFEFIDPKYDYLKLWS